MVPSLAPAWWVTRWLARSVAMLAMTAFTALALALGAGAAAVPAVTALPPPGTVPAVEPARVTVAADATAELGAERADVAPADQPPVAPGAAAATASDEGAAPVALPVTDPAGAVPATPVGERAPPGR